MISPKGLGTNPVRITARSTEAADAVIKEILVEPEGIEVEIVGNHVLSDGHRQELSLPCRRTPSRAPGGPTSH